jgi:HEAT repeat protein
VVRPEVRRTLSTVIERLAARDPGQLVRLLSESDPALVAGAARLVGRSGMGEAAPLVSQLLARNEAEIRLAAVAALHELRVSSAAGALQRVLDDPERDVRIAAARALGSLRYTPARSRLQDAVASRRLRDADVTERIAFFEAFGSVAGAEGVSVLARLLTGRNWLGRREPPEIRACAALALGRIRDPDAMRVLQTASEDPEPVVRAAVTRSLRGEGR